jgi:hypothetical protein
MIRESIPSFGKEGLGEIVGLPLGFFNFPHLHRVRRAAAKELGFFANFKGGQVLG